MAMPEPIPSGSEPEYHEASFSRMVAEDARQLEHATRIQAMFDRLRQGRLHRDLVRRGLELLAMGEVLDELLPNDYWFALWPQNNQIELPDNGRFLLNRMQVLREDGRDARKAQGSTDGTVLPQLVAAPGYYRLGTVGVVPRMGRAQVMVGMEWMRNLSEVENPFELPEPYRNYQVYSWLENVGSSQRDPIEPQPLPEPEEM